MSVARHQKIIKSISGNQTIITIDITVNAMTNINDINFSFFITKFSHEANPHSKETDCTKASKQICLSIEPVFKPC
jgi:hypothetical protein